jgi:hypothetical protein
MHQLFRDLWYAYETEYGAIGWVILWFTLGKDFIRTIPLEHLAEWRYRMHQTQTKLLKLEFGLLVIPLIFLLAVFLEQKVGTPFLMNALYPWTPKSVAGKLMDGIVVFGPLLALVLNLVTVVRVQWDFRADNVVTISIRKASLWQYLGLLVSIGLIALFGAYFFFENLPCLLGQTLTC